MDRLSSRRIPGCFFSGSLFISPVVFIPIASFPFFGTEIVEAKILKEDVRVRSIPSAVSFPSEEWDADRSDHRPAEETSPDPGAGLYDGVG